MAIMKPSYKNQKADKPSYAPTSKKSVERTTYLPSTKEKPVSEFEVGYLLGYKATFGKEPTMYDKEKFSISYLESDIAKANLDPHDLGYVLTKEWKHFSTYLGGYAPDTPTIKFISYNFRDCVAFYTKYIANNRHVFKLLAEVGVELVVDRKDTYKHTPKEDRITPEEIDKLIADLIT